MKYVKSKKLAQIETDVLIVGSGPAGASAALFLSNYGIKTTVITKYRWLADTPRAHITNQRTMEILQDAGILDEVLADSVPNYLIGNSILCESLTGREIGRIKSWGAASSRISEYKLNSPFEICDIPQNYLEPILISNAVKKGTNVRFSTEFISLTQDDESVDATVKDKITGEKYLIRAKYLIGADGGRSRVANSIDLPMIGEMGLAGSINILFKADLTKHVAHRPSALFWMLNPEARIGGLGVGLLRMVRPWNEWLCVWSYDISHPKPELTEAEAIDVIHKILGESETSINISSISTWSVNKAYADYYSSGRVFCVGDAVHRHPPNNGLGSNTSIQDSYNLAWKLAYVLKEIGGKGLLDTYSIERAPIGKAIVLRAIESIKETKELLSVLEPNGCTGKLDIDSLFDKSATGTAVRDKLALAIEKKNNEFNCLGIESNIVYQSAAVVHGVNIDFKIIDQIHSVFHSKIIAGARIPHVWITKKGKEISTLDLIGKGKFTLIVGSSCYDWAETAIKLASDLSMPLNCYRIGSYEEIQDIYFDLKNRIGFKESNFILIRPDGHIAWFGELKDNPSEKINKAFKDILQIEDYEHPNQKINKKEII
ncbi:FAD-dependent monooxygenase [Xenorhabdus bovienii]|uniref:FAD-dependent oxidoreductase n=1 Tax=Xenorhabdus bovienii TaxID=40576 RepID=UPI001EDFB6A4|nr:FAD-dependent monooxygenase [Xenorhabdus bovienii]MCG3463994.1 FAD-dependent monooxygenase [Xenorhabdus bovienii]